MSAPVESVEQEAGAAPPKRPDPAKQAGFLVLGSTFATLSSALSPLLVVRLIGKPDVASLMSVTLVYETLATLLSTGLPYTLLYQVSNRELPERAAIARRIALVAGSLGAAGGLLIGVVFLAAHLRAFGWVPDQDTSWQLGLLLWLAPTLALDLPFRLLPSLLIAEGEARRSAGLQVVRTLALTLATLVPLALQAGVHTVILTYAVVRTLFGLWLFRELRRLYAAVPRRAATLNLKELLAFAIPMGATDALGAMNAQLDRWLVLLVLPGARLADYQLGAFQIPVIATIAYSVGAAYTPELVRRFQARDPYGALAIWQRGIVKVSLIVVPVTMALVVGAEELMSLLFTRAYVDAASIFRFYSVLTFLRVAAYGTVIASAGRPGYVVRAAGLGFFYNVAFGVPLVLTLGFIGPAVGAALAFVLHVATYVYYIARAANVPMSKVFPLGSYSRIFGLSAVAGALGYGVKRSLSAHPTPALFAEIVVVLGVFAVLGTLTGLIERSDWQYVRRLLKLKR
ncbi:MAG TPA: oligosaccharide flippase family protein [Polyangiaceae bacterium]